MPVLAAVQHGLPYPGSRNEVGVGGVAPRLRARDCLFWPVASYIGYRYVPFPTISVRVDGHLGVDDRSVCDCKK